MTTRSFTSAVPGMSVSDMRKCLAEVRSLLQEQSIEAPFDLQHTLSNNMTVWQFVHEVALGLHHKRATNRKKTRVENVEPDEKLIE